MKVVSASLCAFALAVAFAASSTAAQEKVLKFIPQADLRILDPITTTAYITRNHGYMVYDTLFATDAKFQIQPQMVNKWEFSRDKLTYTFTLRDGLKFHDGQPVRSADCIASIERWGRRDALGQRLAQSTESWTAVSDKTFKLKLKKPFPLTLDALGKLSSNVPFIMPERIAKTDAFQNITEAIGSGPFKFVKEEWVPGSKVVYVKNTDYVPRKEAPSWAAGGKVVKVDRVEWIYIPDSATAAAALSAGEADWWEQLPPDLIPLLRKNKDLRVENIDPLGSLGVMRFNFLQPPFNNQKLREALLYVVNQQDYVLGIAGDEKNGHTCYSFFTCGTPLSSEIGAEPLKGKRDFDKAKQLIRESGYKGEKIVIISATDQPIVHAQSLITTELLRNLGSTWSCRRATGARSSPAAPPRSRSRRAVGRSSIPGWSGRTCSRRPTWRWPIWARRPGSAGPAIRSSRSCAKPGSTRPTPRRAKKPPMRCNSPRSDTCLTSRLRSSLFRPPIARTCPA